MVRNIERDLEAASAYAASRSFAAFLALVKSEEAFEVLKASLRKQLRDAFLQGWDAANVARDGDEEVL